MTPSADQAIIAQDVQMLLGDNQAPYLYDRERYHAWAARRGYLVSFDVRLSIVTATRFGDDGKLHRVVWRVRFK